ncbi:MAG: PilX N-terminal domain-containing pilus assembly protein, partial [Nitrospirales bacterium]
MNTVPEWPATRGLGVLGRQDGIALLTVVLLMVVLTILGIMAITVSGLENRMAGHGRTAEAAMAAA